MRGLFAGFVVLMAAAGAWADSVTLGELHTLTPENKTIAAKPKDLVEIHIPNPALAQRVSDLEIKAAGGVKLVGAVNAERLVDGHPVPGGSYIQIVASVEKGVRSGTLDYSYKDGAGTKHEYRVVVQIGG
jgi:hypothetical protein